MIYKRILPSSELWKCIECYWFMDSEDDTHEIPQKIIPDGYPEIILHYGDPFQVNTSGVWELQSKYLIAGQIRNHFFLKNTGRSGMIGIKFKPTALYQLFGIEMSQLTNKVLPLEGFLPNHLKTVESILGFIPNHELVIDKLEEWISSFVSNEGSLIDNALSHIMKEHGIVNMQALTDITQRSERQLERIFRSQVGLTPKFYSRIIRFSYIFDQIKAHKFNWARVAFLSGFTDQSHFIKNFKEFTGEDPSKYLFEDENLGNFFLKK